VNTAATLVNTCVWRVARGAWRVAHTCAWSRFIDDFSIHTRALRASEILSPRIPNLDQSLGDPSLVMYYDFNALTPLSPATDGGINHGMPYAPNLGTAGSPLDLLLGSSHLGPSILAPLLGTADPTVGDAVCRYTAATPPVMCAPASRPTLAPGYNPHNDTTLAIVASAVINGPSISIPLPPPHPPFIYTPPPDTTAFPTSWDGWDSFLHSPSNTVITVRFSTPPTATDLSLALVEDFNATIVLSLHDPLALPLSATILSLPQTGTLYACDVTDVPLFSLRPTALPIILPPTYIRLKFVPARHDTNTQSFTYTATNTHNLTSPLAAVSLEVIPTNDKPNAPPESATVGGHGVADDGLVPLNITVDDPDNDFTVVTIVELPILGSLFTSTPSQTLPLTRVPLVPSPTLTPPPISQHPTKVLETSTFWPSGPEKHWHPEMALGPPDAKKVRALANT